MPDLIALWLVRAFNVLYHIMPIRFDLWAGRNFGRLAYYLSGRRRNVTYANLKAAFYKEKTPSQLKRITKNTYIKAVEVFAELLSMTKVDKRYIERYVNVVNFERIAEAAKNPKGMILVSAHLGNWELSIACSAMKGFPLYIVGREQNMKALSRLLDRLRESKGNIVIQKGMDIRRIFRILHEGKSLGLLADQNAGPSGKLVEFFGRPASTAVGPYRFAQKSGATILPAFIHRKDGPYQDLVLEKPMIIKKDEDIIPYMREYNRLLEKHIRLQPDEWLWMHKRWKMTPVKKVMVLDDGRKGHLKQSLAAVKQIKRYRQDKGFRPEDVEVDIVKIRFKNRLAKTVFNSLSAFFTPNCYGCLRCLKAAITPESYREASRKYADVIVSCGSVLSAVNILLKMENNAHNLTVLDPGFLNRRQFDVIVVPRHDAARKRIRKTGSMVVTDLAPNLIEADEMNALRDKGGGDLQKKGDKICMGLLFGGDNPYFTFSGDLTRLVARGIKDASQELDAVYYVTTSRRTSDSAENILSQAFRDDPRCLKFVSGKSDEDKRTVEKILAASDIVIVSGESISMVSEAVASGRKVLVFMPEKKTSRKTKYESFARDLERKGYLRCVKAEEIAREAARLQGETASFILPDDDRRIYEKVARLF